MNVLLSFYFDHEIYHTLLLNSEYIPMLVSINVSNSISWLQAIVQSLYAI